MTPKLHQDEEGSWYVDVPWRFVYGSTEPLIAMDDSDTAENRTYGRAMYVRLYVDPSNATNGFQMLKNIANEVIMESSRKREDDCALFDYIADLDEHLKKL